MFDIHLDLAATDLGIGANLNNPGSPPIPESDIFSAIRDGVQKLGLRLESSRGPREFLIIDSAEKPSAN
jgi:uncharacterized protein (TIGR03435 family)